MTGPDQDLVETAKEIVRSYASTINEEYPRQVIDVHAVPLAQHLAAANVLKRPGDVVVRWRPIAEAPRGHGYVVGVQAAKPGQHQPPPFVIISKELPEGFTHWSPGAGWQQLGRDWPCYPTHFILLPEPPQ